MDPAYLLPDETGTNMDPIIAAIDTMDPVPVVQQILEAFDCSGPIAGLADLATAPGRRCSPPCPAPGPASARSRG